MKKVVALLLLAVMLLTSLCSCAVDMEDLGSIIPMYLSAPQTNLDPTRMIYDKDFVKVAGLAYAGLTEIDSSREIKLLVASNWTTKYDDQRGEYYISIDLVSSRWNDGRSFTADHVIYAWKRVLSPEVASPAASLLYDIKNAKAVKAGLMSIDDLGVAAVDTNTIEIELEHPIEPELFLEAISSPSLVPLRDDAIVKKEDIWATNINDIATNGRFSVKAMDPAGEYRLDFSKYYRLSSEPKKGYNVYVKPYQLITDYSKTKEEAIDQLKNGEIYYVGDFTKETYAANEKDIESSMTLSSYTYYFDCENKVLSNAKVRKALSVALDRTEIANLIGMGTQAAEGFVSPVASGSAMKKNFRDEAGKVYNTAADVTAAKALLSEAGVSSGSFSITYREDRPHEEAVAQYAKGVWESLGFKVSLKAVDLEDYEEALYESDFDVIGLDYFALSTNPYAALSPFAPEYSGSVVSVDVDSSGITPHVTGYTSEAYTKLLDELLALTTRKERNEKLIEIEKLFADESPATALVFYANSYLASDDLKGLDVSPYGYTLFTEAEVKGYDEKNVAYLEKKEQEEAAKKEENKK